MSNGMNETVVHYMTKALEFKARSKNTNRQVGAVITNGVGAHNTFLTHRETRSTTQHAEAHAICLSAAAGKPTRDHEIYVTLSPCIACAKLIIQAGIKTVHFYEYDPEQDFGLELLKLGGVNVKGPLDQG